MGVVQFISTTIYFLLFQSTADRNHPSVMAFEVYIQRILNCSTNNVTVPVIFTALFYVDRYAKRLRLNGISRRDSEAQILVASLMLADVYHNDAAYAVCSWSELSSFPTIECIKMRKQFLEIIDYDLYLSFEQYSRWIIELKRISNLVTTVMYYNQNKTLVPINTPPMSYQSLMRTDRQQSTEQSYYQAPSPNRYGRAKRSGSLMSGNLQDLRVNRGASDSSLMGLSSNPIGNPANIHMVRSRSGNELYGPTPGSQIVNYNFQNQQPITFPQQVRNHSVPNSAMDRKTITPYPNHFVSPPVQPQGTDHQPQNGNYQLPNQNLSQNGYPNRIHQPF